MQTENGKIGSTMLGNEDHGIFTCQLTIEFDGTVQGFGGYALDKYDSEKKRRLGTAYGLEFIKRILETLEVTSWEMLKGQHLRVRRKEECGPIISIGHITKNKWFTPSEDLADFITKGE